MIYGVGAVMGFTPAQVDDMGLWEFLACKEGYEIAHGGKKPKGSGDIDEDRLRELGIEGF